MIVDLMEMAMLELQHDNIYRKIPREKHDFLVKSAMLAGEKAAKECQQLYKTTDGMTLAKLLGLEVVKEDGNNRMAEYLPKKQRIVLYGGLHEEVVPWLFCRAAELEGFCLLHEIYHHLDNDIKIAEKHRISILKIWKFELTSGVTALAEIAANTFAYTCTCIGIDIAGRDDFSAI